MQSLTHQVFLLAPPGGVFDETVVRNLFPDKSDGARALLVHRATQKGEVLRLKPGLFVLAPEYRRTEPHPFAIADLLHSPSHVSLESALAFHGLIPEAVYQVSSATTLRSRSFRTPLGVFTFHRVPAFEPLAGVEVVGLEDGFWTHVATPLRAIADLVYLRRGITWEEHGLTFLTESLRIDRDELGRVVTTRSGEVLAAFRSRRVRGFVEGLTRELKP